MEEEYVSRGTILARYQLTAPTLTRWTRSGQVRFQKRLYATRKKYLQADVDKLARRRQIREQVLYLRIGLTESSSTFHARLSRLVLGRPGWKVVCDVGEAGDPTRSTLLLLLRSIQVGQVAELSILQEEQVGTAVFPFVSIICQLAKCQINILTGTEVTEQFTPLPRVAIYSGDSRFWNSPVSVYFDGKILPPTKDRENDD